MKMQTSMTAITRAYYCFRVGYCDLQNIFRYVAADYYNCGVYGWNCDVYTCGSLAITTGYRNMRGKSIPEEVLSKYDNIAKEILSNTFKKPYEEIRAELDANLENFWNELRKLV